jgi:hypothetical protein
MKKRHLNVGTLYQVIHPDNPKKYIYAVIVRVEISDPFALMLPVYQFQRDGQRLIIESPKLVSKTLNDQFFRIEIDDIVRRVFFQGNTIKLGQKDINFISNEGLYFSIGHLNQKITHYMEAMTGDDIALETAETFAQDAMNMVEWLSRRIYTLEKEPSKRMEIFQYGLYRVVLMGEIGSEKTGAVDVLVWQKYLNHDQPDKSTFFCFPISYKEVTETDINRIPVLINQKRAWVNVSNGRRISFLRFDHPIYDLIQQRATFVLKKDEIHDINAAFMNHYSRI